MLIQISHRIGNVSLGFKSTHFYFLGLKSEFVMQVEWEKTALQELDITATDLSSECLIDMLTRIPALRFLRAGQINGFNDSVI